MKARYLCIRGCTYTVYVHIECRACCYDASIGWISTSLGVGDASRHETTRAYNERPASHLLSPLSFPFCVRRRRRRPLALERHRTLFRRFYLRGNSKGDGQLYHQRRSLTGRRRRRDAATRGDRPPGYDTLNSLVYEPRGDLARTLSRVSLLFSFFWFSLLSLSPPVVSFCLLRFSTPARKITLDPDSDIRENF